MLNLIIDTIGIICAVGLAWCLFRASLPKTPKDGQAEQILLDDYLRKITVVTGLSAYDAFRISGREWRVSDDRIEQDFKIYLSSQTLPYYVQDFIRKSRKHIDEMYVGSGGFATNKKLAVFFSFFALVFWGGAVVLCVYVLPIILPGLSGELMNMQHLAGPP
jgi:hypothetical protein